MAQPFSGLPASDTIQSHNWLYSSSHQQDFGSTNIFPETHNVVFDFPTATLIQPHTVATTLFGAIWKL